MNTKIVYAEILGRTMRCEVIPAKTRLTVNNWSNEAKIGRLFSWLTRIQAGRKFGSIPIGWYQMHQCACLNILAPLCADNPVRCKGGHIQAQIGGKWRTVISAIELFQQADNQSRL